MTENDRILGTCYAIGQLMRLQWMAPERASRIERYAGHIRLLTRQKKTEFHVLSAAQKIKMESNHD